MCVYAFVVYMCLTVCIFLNQLSFSPVHKAWGLDLVAFLHRREVAQSHFPVCPSFAFVIPQTGSSNCLSHPLALSFTALQVSPQPDTIHSPSLPSHYVFDCLTPPSTLIFFSLSVRLILFFSICFVTFPAVVFLSLLQTFSLSSLIPFSALSRTVICVYHPSVIHMDYNCLPKHGFHNKWY